MLERATTLAIVLAAIAVPAGAASTFLAPVQVLRNTPHEPRYIAVSPDGANIYASTVSFPNTIAAYRVDSDLDSVDFIEAYSDGVDGVHLSGYPQELTVSPDGAHVYVGQTNTDDPETISVFRRDAATGRLTFVQETKSHVFSTFDITVSADGTSLYIVGREIGVFQRDPASGKISFVQVISDSNLFLCVGVSPDGNHVYAGSYTGTPFMDILTVYDRNSATGALTFSTSYTGGGIYGPTAVLVSQDGAHVYVGNDLGSSVTVYSRNSVSGALTLVENETQSTGRVIQLGISPGGEHVYAGSGITSHAIGVYDRNPGTGALTFKQTVTNSLNGYESMAVSPTGAYVFAGSGFTGALPIFARDGVTGQLTFVRLGGTDDLDGAFAAAATPDGAHVYVASADSSAIAGFARDGATGKLTQVDADGASGAAGVAVSPDGAHVYAAASTSNRIQAYSRNAGTGALTQIQQLVDGSGGVDGLGFARALEVAPDGKHVYVAGGTDDAVAVFSRNAGTGQLAFVEAQFDGIGGVDGLNGASSVAIAPDGTSVYVAGTLDDAVAVFSRGSATGALVFVEMEQTGLTDPSGVAVSPDGLHVYVSGRGANAIALFDRNPGTGALTFSAGYAEGVDGVEGFVGGASAVAVSPDGTSVLAAGDVGGTVGLFGRDAGTGELIYHNAVVDGVDLGGVAGLAVSPDNANVYAAAATGDAIVTLRFGASPCTPAPLGACLAAGRTIFQILDHADDASDKLIFRWLHGAATTSGDLGDPSTSTTYAVCVYEDTEGTPTKVLDAVAPVGGLCGSRDCWKRLGPLPPSGWNYTDRNATPHGLTKIVVKAGGAGSAKLLAKGKGGRVAPPALPLTLPVAVQVVNSDGTCWTATYAGGAVIKNEAQSSAPGRFKAVANTP